MKKLSGVFTVGIFLVLIGANVFIFLSGMKVSEQINFYETETKKLKQENIDLEKKAYAAESLQNAASVAAQLEFTKKAEPYFLENLRFALNEKR